MPDGSAGLIRLPRSIRAADLFCGAGGTSTGARRAMADLGVKLNLTAINHWATAIETHSRMHPEARHLCADLEHVRPLQVVPSGMLDLLMASPTCTYYSRARGGRPVHDQQRMDPWHVVRWCTEIRVRRVLVENVREMTEWGPCSRTGRPIKARKGEYFRAWLSALQAIGLRVEYRILNCADYGDATTRERFFLLARADGEIRWPEPTHCRGGSATKLPWRGAHEIIDWSDLGSSLFARQRPLVAATIRRILAGAVRYDWPRPYLEALQALLDGREPRLRITQAEAAEIAERAGQSLVMATGAGGAARGVELPIPTATGGGEGGARPHFITPLIAPYYGGGSGLTASSAHEPLDAVTTKARFGLALPILTKLRGTSAAHLRSSAIGVDNPVPTISAGGNRGGKHIALATPASDGYAIDVYYRMLHWRELARAMSFDDDGEAYDFVGTDAEITKQIGNAVPGRTAKALIKALFA